MWQTNCYHNKIQHKAQLACSPIKLQNVSIVKHGHIHTGGLSTVLMITIPCAATTTLTTIPYAAPQSTSMVKDGHRFLPKEYSLKLQAVGQGKGGEHRQTIAKCRLDLARYCSCDQVFAQEVTLELK